MLKNVILSWLDGRPRLYDRNGSPIDAFNRFTAHLYRSGTTKLSETSKENYSEHTAKLFDYLVEFGVLDSSSPPTQQTLSDAILMYPRFLVEGVDSKDPIIRKVAISLQVNPVTKDSAGTYLAGPNLFLKITHDIEKRNHRLEQKFGMVQKINIDAEYIGNERMRGVGESNKISEHGLIAANMPQSIDRKTASAPLTISRGSKHGQRIAKDFPYAHLQQVMNLSSPRNKCLMYFMAAGGLRFSEAIAVQKPLIDHVTRKIRIEDPNNIRNSKNYAAKSKYKWKGRETAIVYLFEPLKSLFFDAYAEYLAVRPTSDSDFLFLYEDNDHYGLPLIKATNTANLNGSLNHQFKAAQQEHVRQLGDCGSDFSPYYTLHSLRHFYGMWLRNRVQVPGRMTVGLELSEIQIMMGHKRLSSTEIYSRRASELIEIDLQLADYLIATNIGHQSLAFYAADQLERLAAEIRKTAVASVTGLEKL